MGDGNKKFHEFALKSTLFKGRPDWYFCYLKTEKIAHVLSLLAAEGAGSGLWITVDRAGEIPQAISRLAAGDTDLAFILADVFSMLTIIRMNTTRGLLHKETGAVIVKEYEEVAQRLLMGSHPSPFMAVEDLRVSALPELESPLAHPSSVKDTPDGSKMSDRLSDKKPTERMSVILSFIQKHKQASIKEIAAVVKGCSEKTIQRELGALIEQGLIRKVGERRWSVYVPA